MKVLRGLFGLLHIIGYAGNGILFLYIEWCYVRNDWVEILNPFLHIKVLITLLTTPLFWIFLVLTVLGLFAAKGAQGSSRKY